MAIAATLAADPDEEVKRTLLETLGPPREILIGLPDLLVKVCVMIIGFEEPRKLALLLDYAHYRCVHGSKGGKKKATVDVDQMVQAWVETIVGLSTGHDHATYTDADHSTDDILGPMLTAPIRQIREFARKLAAALEADPRVPFLIWSYYKRVFLPIIESGPDSAAIELKAQLAAEIAQKVEQGLDRGELVQALAGALQWRAPATLEKVNTALGSGEKPRIKGRESCLFLEVAGERVVI